MSDFFEDRIPASEWAALIAVEESESDIFSDLIASAGLDPSTDLVGANLDGVDLRGSDVRGFNFSGCSMNMCIRDESTRIDSTTIFPDDVSWVPDADLPLYKMMMRAQSERGMSRKQAISEMLEEYGETRHVLRFLKDNAMQATSWLEYMDYLDLVSSEFSEHQESDLRKKLSFMVEKSMNARNRQRKQLGRGQIRLNDIVHRLKNSPNPMFIEIVAAFESTELGSDSERLVRAILGGRN